jgi:hypothetical protein
MFPYDVNREIRSAVAQAQRDAYDLYVKKRNVRLERALHEAWVNFTEYHSMQEGLDVLAREAESHGNLEAAEALLRALDGPVEKKESLGPLTKRVRRILKRVAFIALILTAVLIPGVRAQSETINYRVEISDREQVTIWLTDREFVDAEYLSRISKRLKAFNGSVVTVSRNLDPAIRNAIVLNAPREHNPALVSATAEQVSAFWSPCVSLTLGMIRAKLSPKAMLVQDVGAVSR